MSPSLMTKFAALNSKGAAESLLQTLECRGRIEDWHAFRDAVFARFDKDQCKIQLRQFDSLCHTGSVIEYLERLEEFSHGVLLFNAHYYDTYIVIRFLCCLN